MADRNLVLWETWRARRDDAAFEALVRPDLGRALGLACSVGCSREDAEDAVQEALSRLAMERGDAPRRVGVRAWFFRTVRDRARVRVRSGRRRRSRERAAARPEGVEEDGSGLAVREQVERALLGLGEEEREAIRLRFLQDLDYAEMAYVLDASENACRLRVHRALGKLKARLGAGAAALIAALPLPSPADAAVLVKGALASAAGAGSAGAATTGGALAMATTGKVVVGTSIGIALGLTGGLAMGTLGAGGASPGAAPTVRVAEGPPRESPPALPSGAAPRPGNPDRGPAATPALAGVRDLDPTPEETEFLRTALLAERRRREAARIRPEDEGADLLRRMEESGADVGGTLADFASLASHVRTGGGDRLQVSALGDPTEVNLADLAGKSAVIEFGPGRFEFDPRGRAFHRLLAGKEIESLEVRGAGMDLTTLVGTNGEFLMVDGGARVRNLRFRDLTFDPGKSGKELLDVRGGVSLALESVRFTAPAGHEVLMFSGTTVLAAKGCEFLGGTNSLPLRFAGTSLAVFEDCLFADHQSVFLGWSGASAKSRVSLIGCTFENAKVSDSRILYQGKPEYPIRMRGGRVRFGPPGMAPEERRKRAGAGYLALVDGVVFEEGPPRCRVSDLLSVLDRTTLGADEVILAVRFLAATREGTQTFALTIGNRSNGHSEVRSFRWFGGVLEPLDREDRGGGFWTLPVNAVDRQMPVAAAVRAAGIPETSGAVGIEYSSPATVDGVETPTVRIHGPEGWPEWTLDALSGKTIFGPR